VGNNPTMMGTKEDYIASLTPDVLLFAPGTGILYSNFGFDLLAQALANAAGKPYARPPEGAGARPCWAQG